MYKNIYQYFYKEGKGLFAEHNTPKKDDKEFSYLWPLCALIQTVNELELPEPGKQYMKQVVRTIDKYYDKKPPHPGYDSYPVEAGGGDRFYDDNQWIGIAYMDAYNRTKDIAYLNLSKEIYGFMMTGYDTVAGGGLYWKEFDNTTKNTCSNGPGVLLALQLYKATAEKKYLDTALLLYNWVNKNLLAPDGLYYDNIKLPSLDIDKRKYTYNTGTMLQSAVLLYDITKNKSYLEAAQKMASSSLAFFYKNGMFPNHYWFNAVLLRGYIELAKFDNNKEYIAVFKTYADKVWETQKDKNGLIGTQKEKALIDQAAYLEILTRLQPFL
ncbi:glycoside hydrolase [Terrimonas sp.]|nr:glycoside hydrolase [Terrimonas sp.]